MPLIFLAANAVNNQHIVAKERIVLCTNERCGNMSEFIHFVITNYFIYSTSKYKGSVDGFRDRIHIGCSNTTVK